MPSIVGGDTDRADIFLHCSSYNVLSRSMIAKIDHLDSVPDQFKINRIDSTVMPVTNWHSGQDPDRFHRARMQNLRIWNTEYGIRISRKPKSRKMLAQLCPLF